MLSSYEVRLNDVSRCLPQASFRQLSIGANTIMTTKMAAIKHT